MPFIATTLTHQHSSDLYTNSPQSILTYTPASLAHITHYTQTITLKHNAIQHEPTLSTIINTQPHPPHRCQNYSQITHSEIEHHLILNQHNSQRYKHLPTHSSINHPCKCKGHQPCENQPHEMEKRDSASENTERDTSNLQTSKTNHLPAEGKKDTAHQQVPHATEP